MVGRMNPAILRLMLYNVTDERQHSHGNTRHSHSISNIKSKIPLTTSTTINHHLTSVTMASYLNLTTTTMTRLAETCTIQAFQLTSCARESFLLCFKLLLWQEPISIGKLHGSQRGNYLGPRTVRPQAKWFLEPEQVSTWELCNFSMGMNSCVYTMTHANESITRCWEMCNFSTEFDNGHGYCSRFSRYL